MPCVMRLTTDDMKPNTSCYRIAFLDIYMFIYMQVFITYSNFVHTKIRHVTLAVKTQLKSFTVFYI